MNRKMALSRLLLISLSWQLAHCTPCRGQGHVVLDGTLGPSGALSGPNFNITANLGTTVGNNLFHSFSQFNLVSGDVATFTGPVNIRNVIARVTGGSASSIDGTIDSSSMPNANFFLINPFGVIFGKNAQLNVGGSVVVTSASYLKFSDGGRFDAANPANDVLTTAPVSAFGFSSTPGSISVQQSTLAVAAGQSFSLIGGDITIEGATIQAPGGRINLVSIKSAGELALDVTDFAALPDTSAFSTLGQITVQSASGVQGTVDASGDGGGQVVIRGGTLVVDGSVVEANTLGATDGKGIDIDVTGDLTVDGGAISASTSSSGKGGSINITAGSISLDGQGATAGILSDAISGSGNGGDISIHASSLEILNGARISAATADAGNGGNITVNADAIHIDAEGAGLVTGIAVGSASTDPSGGAAGNIVIGPFTHTLALQIVNGGVVSATTDGGGAGGSVDVVADTVQLDNQGGIEAMTFGSGQGGDISIQTRAITLSNGSEIGAQTQGSGGGGNISVMADTMQIQSSSAINAQTFGLGPGGNINLTATTSLVVDGKQSNGSTGSAEITAGNPFGIVGSASAGNIVISAGLLEVLNGADISTSTKGDSDGGNITIGASELTLQNRASIQCSSVSGQAGGITITTTQGIMLDDHSILSVSALNNDGGDIHVSAGGDIRILNSQITSDAAQDGGNITLESPSLVYLLNSELDASAGNNGGNVTIDPQFVVLNSGKINTSAGSNGGNITIASAFVFASPSLNQSLFFTGKKGVNGTVQIEASTVDLSGVLVGLPASLLDAESQLRPYCGVKLSGGVSSFLVVGHGGVPLEPDGVSPSFGLPAP